jgi:hypothetical protein
MLTDLVIKAEAVIARGVLNLIALKRPISPHRFETRRTLG